MKKKTSKKPLMMNNLDRLITRLSEIEHAALNAAPGPNMVKLPPPILCDVDLFWAIQVLAFEIRDLRASAKE